MSLITPDSTVELYKDIPITFGNQLVFKSKTEQSTYFATKKNGVVPKENVSYIRKTGKLRLSYSTKIVNSCNYLSFLNKSFENMRFYARITNWEYVNNNTTDIMYEIDYWQTNMFDASYHACSIIREHLTESDFIKAKANPWRNDISELLTDEQLPCDKSLEKNYTVKPFASDSEMSYLIHESSSTSTIFSVIILSHFDSSEWDENDQADFLSLIEYFGSGDIYTTPTAPPDTIEKMFGYGAGIFPSPCALIGIRYTDTYHLEKLVNYLTIYGVSGSIIGMYALPYIMLSGLFKGDATASTDWFLKIEESVDFEIKPAIDNDVDPKLNTFPYKILRVYSPKDIKEYDLRLFKDMRNGNDKLHLRVASNIYGLPTTSLYPMDYKYIESKSEAGSVNTTPNYFERIDFTDFPQISYSVDAYLTFLSNQYNEAAANNTIAGQSQLVSQYNSAQVKQNNAMIPSVAGLFAQALTNTYGNQSVKNLMDAAQPAIQSPAISAQAKYEAAKQDIDITNESLSSRGDFSSAVFDSTKRAYANDQYVPNGTGIVSMYTEEGFGPYFMYQITSLNDDILDKYSTYLKIYGYKSLRTGVPHICDYIKNGTNKPHFSKFDGENITYIMTENMSVTGLPQVACSFIENIFNNGCRFIDPIERS